jgi:hypothetical protein
MTIPTVDTLRTGHRRLDKRIEQAEQVIQAMRAGAVLHMQLAKAGPRWALSNGRQVTDDVAKLVVTSSSIVGDGDALFGECQAQTFRWWQERNDDLARQPANLLTATAATASRRPHPRTARRAQDLVTAIRTALHFTR